MEEIIIYEADDISCRDIIQLRRDGFDTWMKKNIFMARRDTDKNGNVQSDKVL